MQKIPTLIGTAGHVEGEKLKLEYGKTLVVGRSRSADFSLRRIQKIADMGDEEREADQNLRTVSGKHFEITMYNMESIEIVNLSPNGTYVDGTLVDKLIVSDIAEKAHEVKIGAAETFSLEVAEYEDAE
jgi:pSer/pThr/pTyr-binding forkhead associated (FHA) protein